MSTTLPQTASAQTFSCSSAVHSGWLFLWVCFCHVGLLISSVSSENNWKTPLRSILHCCKIRWEPLRRNTFCGDSSEHSLHARSVLYDTAIAALTTCDPAKLRNVRQLLLILGTLPCESERVFSKLQQTLADTCSTMKEDHLESLLLQCHRDLCPTTEQVLDEFASSARPRRLTVSKECSTLRRCNVLADW